MEAIECSRSPRSAHILLVEDEKDVREILRKQLEADGHEVAETSSGSEALVLAERSPFDVVLTDVMIPDLDGIQLVQRVSRLPSSPVTIVMTGFGSIEMAVKAIKAGAFDFLQKPFSMEVLSATVESALRVKSLRDENRELRRTVKGQFGLGNLISVSEVMKEVF